MSVAKQFRRKLISFVRSSRANVAIIFGLSLIPITLAAGVGIDLARGLVVQTSVTAALDAAGLALGSTSGLTQSQMQTMAQQYFNANYKADPSFGTPAPITVTAAGQQITLSTSVAVPTTLMAVAGINTMPVNASSEVVWGQSKLWVALVLDNTGSMTQTDASGTSKISALKTASTNLLTMLKGAAVNPGDVMVSIVPFTVGVNVGTANATASWLTFSQWDAVGTGYGSYKFTSGINVGKSCTPPQTNCGWVATNSSHSQWSGCVMDRDQSYDVQNTAPNATNVPTLFPAAPPTAWKNPQHTPAGTWNITCPIQLRPLTDVLNTSGFTALNTEVNNMVAGGGTNQPVGLEMGWMTITNSAPFSPGSLPKDTQPIIIILSDGLNTLDRWTGDGSNQDSGTDARMAQVCTNVKAAGVTVYAVFVDLNGTQGNSTVLQNCASDPSKYFDLTSSTEIVATFNEIGTQITQLRIAK
jgi:Flp pilus assembly protein TadG